jgi:mannose-6-phosphate isomerase-like protein (cupin superfamily)
MNEELLHLSADETVRIVEETPEELLVEAEWLAPGAPPPAHLHPAQDELFEITSGVMRAEIDGQARDLRVGATVEIPRGTPHKMWNPGPAPARAVWRTTPALRTAQWFRTIDRLGEGGTRKPPTAALLKAVAAYDDVFRLAVGPKPLQPVIGAVLGALKRTERK